MLYHFLVVRLSPVGPTESAIDDFPSEAGEAHPKPSVTRGTPKEVIVRTDAEIGANLVVIAGQPRKNVSRSGHRR